MSRRKRRKKQRSADESQAGTSRSTDSQAPADRTERESPSDASGLTVSGKSLVAALIIALVWWLTICSLAIFTANPIVLNRAQLTQAKYIVTAAIVDETAGVVDVKREWKSGAKLGRITIKNLKQTPAETGSDYLIPLSEFTDDRFEVTRAALRIRVTVRPGESIPFDGRIAKIQQGKADVLEAGKIGSVAKQPGDPVVAGSTVERGELTVNQLSPRYVYPVTPKAMRQLRRFLGEQK